MKISSYADAVRTLRETPEGRGLLEHCYLDSDPGDAIGRFARSEEAAALGAILDTLCARSLLKQNAHIVDVGCGNGIATFWFLARGYRVTAIDPDIDTIVGSGALSELCERKGFTSKCTVRVATAEVLPLEDDSCDLLYLRQVAHHFHSLSQGIAECARVVRPGGVLLMTREHVITDEQQRALFLAEHPLAQRGVKENAYRISDYHSALKGAGLTILSTLGHFDSVINHYPTSNREIEGWFAQGIQRMLRSSALSARVSRVLWGIPIIQRSYRARLSRRCQMPGRMSSFIARK